MYHSESELSDPDIIFHENNAQSNSSWSTNIYKDLENKTSVKNNLSAVDKCQENVRNFVLSDNDNYCF